MPIFNFYHPDRRLIAKIKAIDSDEARSRFAGSVNKGFLVDPPIMGRSPDEELEYLYIDWDIINEGLPNGEFGWEAAV